MPSIAVMKAQQADANADYGDISVVFRKDTIDPEVNRSNKVYGGDAWTPRFPTIEYEIDYDQASNIYSRAHELSKTKAAFTKAVSLHPDNIEDSVNRLGIERYIENLKSDYTLKQLYLLEHGGQPVKMQQREERAEVSEADAQKKSVIDEEIAANACFTVLSNENNFTALVKQNRSLAEKVRDFFADFAEKIKNALTRLAKNNAEYKVLQNDDEAQQKILEMFDKCLNLSNSAIKNNGEIKLSIKEDALGKYVDVDTDQQIIEGKTLKESISIINKYMDKKFRGKVFPLSENSKAYVGHKGIDEYSHPARKNIKDDILFSKLKAGTELDNLLAVSVFDEHKEDNGHHPEAVGGWDYYTTVFKVGNNFYQGRVSIEIRQNGKEFKDITKIKGISRTANLSEKTPVDTRNSFTNSISNSDENVKFTLKQNSEGKKLSKQQQEYFKDSKVRDEEGRLLVVYHGTDTDFTVFDRTKARANIDIQGNFFSPWEIDAKGYGEKVGAYYLNIINPAPEGVAYKALNKFKGQNYAGVKARDFLERMGYDGVNNGNEEYIAFYPEQIKLVENTAPTDNSDIRYSLKEENDDYSYDTLVSKPDMPVTVINDQKDYTPGKSTRENVVDEAQRSGLSVGRKDSSGNVYVYVNDTDTEVMLSKRGLRHSLDRRLSIIAPVTENIGPIIKNSVRINELSPEFETIKNSYVLVGIAKNQKNEPYVVSFVVNRASNEVMNVDVLYAVNAKKEATALIEPELSSQSDVSLTASTISISDLLDYVNRYYPDILPEDVLRHYGYTARPDGVIGESALYSLKEEDNTSIFEDNEELAESAADVQNMLRLVSTENNELRKAFDIRTVRQAEDGSVAKVAAYLRKQYDSSYKIQAAQTSNLLSYYVYLFCSGR